MTTGKTIALTRRTFVGKVMSLFFNMLSRLVITFLSRSKCLLISWLQSSTALILEPPKIKFVTVSTVSPSICHKVMGPDAMILFSECWGLGRSKHLPTVGMLMVGKERNWERLFKFPEKVGTLSKYIARVGVTWVSTVVRTLNWTFLCAFPNKWIISHF